MKICSLLLQSVFLMTILSIGYSIIRALRNLGKILVEVGNDLGFLKLFSSYFPEEE